MSAAIEPRGLKRVCASCGIRFYDLNKRPIHCPGCNVEFSGEIKLKARRGRVAAIEAAETPAEAANDQFEEVEATENTISLEEVEEGDDDSDEESIDGGDLETLDDDDLEDEIEVEVEKE